MTSLVGSRFLVDIDKEDNVVVKCRTNKGFEDETESILKGGEETEELLYDLIYAVQKLVKERDELKGKIENNEKV